MATRNSTGSKDRPSTCVRGDVTDGPLMVIQAGVVRQRIEIALSGELAIDRADLAAGEVFRLMDPMALKIQGRECPQPVLVDMRDCLRGGEHRIAGALLLCTVAAAANDGAIAIVGGPLAEVSRNLQRYMSVNVRWFASANDARRWLRNWMIGG